MENFNLDEFLVEQGKINTQLIHSNQNIGMAIKSIKEDSIDILTKEVGNMNNKISSLENDIKGVQLNNKNLKEDNEKAQQDIKELKDKTNVLEFEDTKTLGIIKSTAKSRISHLLGGNDTPQYILFFRTCIEDLYGNINKSLTGGKKLGRIKVEDGECAIIMAKRYFLNKNRLTKKYNEYQKMQSKKILSAEKSKALDLVEEWMEDLI